MTLSKKVAVSLFVGAFFACLGSPALWAEDASRLPQGSKPPQKVQEKMAKLKELKQNNPQEFERVVGERKAKIKEKLATLKEENPQKFQEVREHIRHRRREHLQNLKEKNPEKFEELMKKRSDKLQELKTRNPEHYQQFLETHPGLKENMQAWHPPQGPRDQKENVRDRQNYGGPGSGRR